MGVFAKLQAAKMKKLNPPKAVAPSAWNAMKAAENKATGVTKPISTKTMPKVKPQWTEAKAPVTTASQARDLALAKKVVSTTPGAFAYGAGRAIAMPVTATAKLMGYQESPEEAAVRTLAESKRLTAQMDASKGMGAPQIIQGRSIAPELVGRVAGSILPFSAAESAVGRVLPTLAGQGIAKTAARGAISGGALQALEEGAQGKRGAELAKSVAIGTALGAGSDIGLGYLGKAIRSIKAGAKTADVVADIAQNVPEAKVSIEKELGLPEGSTWADIERKMEAEAKRAELDQKVADYYRSLEERVAPPVEQPKKPYTGTQQYGVPEGKSYEQFAYEQEQAQLADEYMQLLEEGVNAGEVARRVYPGKPFSGTEQYGVPEGMDYATYQKKLDEEEAVKEYYKQFETAEKGKTEYYHVTSEDDFKYNPDFSPEWQTMGKGFYATKEPLKWEVPLQAKGKIRKAVVPVETGSLKIINADQFPTQREMAKEIMAEAKKNGVNALETYIEPNMPTKTTLTEGNEVDIATRIAYAKIKGYDAIEKAGEEGNELLIINKDSVKTGQQIPIEEYAKQSRFVPKSPTQPERVPQLQAQTPDRMTQRISDVGIPQGIVPKAPSLPTAPKAPVAPPRIPEMPDIERELFPSVERPITPSPKLPEPALKTAYERANAPRQAIAPELPKTTARVEIAPSMGIGERVTPEPSIKLDKASGGAGIEPSAAQRADVGESPILAQMEKMPKVSAILPEGQQQSKLYTNTLPKSDIFTPQELENLNIEYEGGYTPKANAETLANAKQRIAENGADVELEKLKQKDSFNSDDFVTSMEILKDKVLAEARATGDYSKVNDMLELIRKSGSTEAGRVVQAHQIYTRTPEGMITLGKKIVDNVNAKGGKATLTPDDIEAIDKSMRKFQELPPGREKDVELAKVKKIIADKIPPTFIDKFRGLQRISWLLNPKTLITRNPLGNVLLQGAEGFKNIPATGLDYLVGLKTGKRTTTTAGGYMKGFVKGAKEQIADIRQGVDTSPTGGQAEITKARTFENETLNKLDNTVSGLLKLGDRPFYEGAFESRLNQLKKLNKSDEVTAAMEEDAKLYALERTLQKDSEIAKAFTRLKKISDNPAWQVFANTLLPFTKTPANILDKMFEYSPGGFIKAATQIGKKGDAFDQKYFVDNVSRALTGTGIMALGYAGAKNGFITGKPDKDKEVAAVERLIGRLPYAFVTDGGSYTFDWAQPVSALLAVGADAYYGGKEKDDFAEQLQGSAEAAGNTFLNMSMLQGFTKAFSGYSPVSGLIKATMEGVTGIATPTLGGQFARTIDPTVRETGGKLIPKMIAKVPGLSKTLPAKLDLFGREVQQSEGRGALARAAENMLSPGYYASGKTSTPGLKEAYRVYKQTGEKDVFPRLAPDTITVKGDTKKLTPELKATYQKQMGELNLRELESMVNSYSYKNASDESKAKMLNKLIKDNREEVKKRLLPEITKLP